MKLIEDNGTYTFSFSAGYGAVVWAFAFADSIFYGQQDGM
jgi:hypothetical protein